MTHRERMAGGTRVKLGVLPSDYEEGPANPLWGGVFGYTAGTITHNRPLYGFRRFPYGVDWDNGHSNSYREYGEIEALSVEELMQDRSVVTLRTSPDQQLDTIIPGSRVILPIDYERTMSDQDYTEHVRNPYYGGAHGKVVGTVTSVFGITGDVKWDNGQTNSYHLEHLAVVAEPKQEVVTKGWSTFREYLNSQGETTC